MLFDLAFRPIQSVEELRFLECLMLGAVDVFRFIIRIDDSCTESDDIVHRVVDGEGDPMSEERIDISSGWIFFC